MLDTFADSTRLITLADTIGQRIGDCLCSQTDAVAQVTFYDTTLWQYILLPMLIVLARITDVSLGTLRIVMVSKGFKKLAPIISFFESLIWVMIVARILADLSNPMSFVGYAVGYALGTLVGMKIENKLSLGNVIVRVIAPKEAEKLEKILRENKFGVTSFDASGKDGMVKVLFIVVQRLELNYLVNLIQKNNPTAFFTIENVHTVRAGYFPEIDDNDPMGKIHKFLSPGGEK